MGKFIGRKGSVGVGVEAVRGTAQVTTVNWLPWLKISFDDKVDKEREKSAFGNIADTDSSYVVSKFAEGEIEGEIKTNVLGAIFKALMGQSSSAVASGTAYLHTFAFLDNNQHASLSLIYLDPNETVVFKKAMVDTLKIVVEPKGIVNYAVGFKSMPSQGWATLTPNYTATGVKFLHQHLTVKVADTIAGLSVATGLDIKKLELTIKKNADFDNVVNSVTPVDVINKEFSVEGKIVINRNDNTFKNYALNGTYKAMEIVLDDGVVLNGAITSKMIMQMPRVDFFEWEQDRGLNDLVTETINFKANYDAVNDLDIISTLSLTNLLTTY